MNTAISKARMARREIEHRRESEELVDKTLAEMPATARADKLLPAIRFIDFQDAQITDPGAIMFLQNGTDFETYGDDAEWMARELYLSLDFARLESGQRTIARLTLAAGLLDGVVSWLSKFRRMVVILSVIEDAADGREPARAVTRRIKPRASAADREAELASLVESLPDDLRVVCAALGKLSRGDRYTVRRYFTRWFKTAVEETEAGGLVVFPGIAGRPALPDPEKLDKIADAMATLSSEEQSNLVWMTRRFSELRRGKETDPPDWDDSEPEPLRLAASECEPGGPGPREILSGTRDRNNPRPA